MGDHRPRKIQCPSRAVGHHLDPRRIVRILSRQRRGGRADVVALGDPLDGAGQGVPRDERLVPLHVRHHVEARELRPAGGFRHAVGSGKMAVPGQHGPRARPLDHLGDHVRIGGHHQIVDDPVLHDALNDPGDERLTGQKLERFVGETGRARRAGMTPRTRITKGNCGGGASQKSCRGWLGALSGSYG